MTFRVGGPFSEMAWGRAAKSEVAVRPGKRVSSWVRAGKDW